MKSKRFPSRMLTVGFVLMFFGLLALPLNAAATAPAPPASSDCSTPQFASAKIDLSILSTASGGTHGYNIDVYFKGYNGITVSNYHNAGHVSGTIDYGEEGKSHRIVIWEFPSCINGIRVHFSEWEVHPDGGLTGGGSNFTSEWIVPSTNPHRTILLCTNPFVLDTPPPLPIWEGVTAISGKLECQTVPAAG